MFVNCCLIEHMCGIWGYQYAVSRDIIDVTWHWKEKKALKFKCSFYESVQANLCWTLASHASFSNLNIMSGSQW